MKLEKEVVKSLLLDAGQVAGLAILAITGPILPSGYLSATTQLLATVVISLGVWEMRRNRFYRVPDIGKQEKLVTTGIFRFIRNPMYLAQIFFSISLLLNLVTLQRFLVVLALICVFLLKIRYEENLLAKHFKEFAGYKKRSFRLIPYLF